MAVVQKQATTLEDVDRAMNSIAKSLANLSRGNSEIFVPVATKGKDGNIYISSLIEQQHKEHGELLHKLFPKALNPKFGAVFYESF